MAITTFAELSTAIGNWLGRSDLAARIPEFIALAEADIRRKLVPAKDLSSITLVAGADTYEISAAYTEVLSLRFDTSTLMFPLRQTTVANLATLRRSGSGLPVYFAVNANDAHTLILFDIAADTDYAMELEVKTALLPLNSTTQTTNAILTRSPDIYLYGALKEAELYLEHDQRNPVWAQKYNQAIIDENIRRERAELGAAPLAPGLPIVFG